MPNKPDPRSATDKFDDWFDNVAVGERRIEGFPRQVFVEYIRGAMTVDDIPVLADLLREAQAKSLPDIDHELWVIAAFLDLLRQTGFEVIRQRPSDGVEQLRRLIEEQGDQPPEGHDAIVMWKVRLDALRLALSIVEIDGGPLHPGEIASR